VTKLPGQGRPWHLIEKPRAPFRCDVCGADIPEREASSFTTLPKMYYETPPTGYVPCNRAGYDAWSAEYEHVSSGDLHPEQGGRFVFTRQGEASAALYRVEVFLPQGRKLESRLRWDDEGRAELDPPLPDAWAHDESLKLARVLHKDPRPRLSRWRGPAAD